MSINNMHFSNQKALKDVQIVAFYDRQKHRIAALQKRRYPR